MSTKTKKNIKTNCSLHPQIGGEDSKLHIDLNKELGTNSSKFVNYIYACYKLPGADAKMDSLGYKRNNQGEHKAKDVIEFLNVKKMTAEAKSALELLEFSKRIGAKDSLGDYINFTNSEQALNIAVNANNISKGIVSYVVRSEDVFNVVSKPVDSIVQHLKHDTEITKGTWDIVNNAFTNIGVDLLSYEFDFKRININALTAFPFVDWLKNLQITENKYLTVQDIQTLITISKDLPQITRLLSTYGTLDKVAETIYDMYKNPHSYTFGQQTLMTTALNMSKKIKGLDLVKLQNDLFDKISDIEVNSEPFAIQQVINDLNTKFKLDNKEVVLLKANNKISSLKEVAGELSISLNRELQELKKFDPTNDIERNKLTSLIDILLNSIKKNDYYTGILSTFQKITDSIPDMNNMINALLSVTGTGLEININRAKIINKLINTYNNFAPILKSIQAINSLNIVENMENTQKEELQKIANNLVEYFDNYKNKIDNVISGIMVDMTATYLGEKTSGYTISNIVAMTIKDGTYLDHLYATGTSSNEITSMLGTVLREAQNKRTVKLRDIAIRIRRANNKLAKHHNNTEFMYEKNGYIISDIDWESYTEARTEQIKILTQSGVKGLAFQEELRKWEKDNTEERIVNYKDGRTELIPNSHYRKAMPILTAAQLEYYNEMMQLKGEIGSLLPEYAQKHYLSPQVRRTFKDALADSKGHPKKIALAILQKMRELISFREDDTEIGANGVIINDQSYAITNSNTDNTTYRDIPIFFINKLKDRTELLKDFSGALSHLAATAVNYECMHEIKDLIEIMQNYITSQIPLEINTRGDIKTSFINSEKVNILKEVRNRAVATNTINILQGFIDQHIYMNSLKDTGWKSKALKNMIFLTSTMSLSVNVKGAVANFLVGEAQMLIESISFEFYGVHDYIWANRKVFMGPGGYGTAIDFFTNNVRSEAGLLAQIFDPKNDLFNEYQNKRFYSSPLRRLVEHDYTYMLYSSGEHLLHFITMYAVLHAQKVYDKNGKKLSLYDAFEYVNRIEGNKEIKVKDGCYYIDENGIKQNIDLNGEFIDKIRNRIRYCNQSCHGAMNTEDKGIVHQRIVGRLFLNLRQWMIGHYSRRFRGRYFDGRLGEYREGYYTTLGKVILGIATDLSKLQWNISTQWESLNKGQRRNLVRALTEMIFGFILFGVDFSFFLPEDMKYKYYTGQQKFWIYQLKRLLMETRSSIPILGIGDLLKTLESPIAAASTSARLFYSLGGLFNLDFLRTMQSGEDAGKNRYWHYFKKYSIPYYNQIKQLSEIEDNNNILKVYDTLIK